MGSSLKYMEVGQMHEDVYRLEGTVRIPEEKKDELKKYFLGF